MSERAKIYEGTGVRQAIGTALREKRIESGHSLSDIADMTGFSKTTVSSMESGKLKNIDYYISYAQAVNIKLPKLFDIDLEYKPRYELSEDKKARVFLSKKIRNLLVEDDLFKEKTTVDDVITRLEEKGQIIRNREVSTNVSRILLNWVEDGTLLIAEKKGRNNVYSKNPK